MELLTEISKSLQSGDHNSVADLTIRAVDSGLAAAAILNDSLIAGMAVVGKRFGAHEIFLPQVLL